MPFKNLYYHLQGGFLLTISTYWHDGVHNRSYASLFNGLASVCKPISISIRITNQPCLSIGAGSIIIF